MQTEENNFLGEIINIIDQIVNSKKSKLLSWIFSSSNGDEASNKQFIIQKEHSSGILG